MRRALLALVSGSLVLWACSSRDTSPTVGSAKTAPPSERVQFTAASDVVHRLAAFAPFAHRLVGEPLTQEGTHWLPAHASSDWARYALSTHLPTTSALPLRLSAGGDFGVEVRAEGDAPVNGEPVDGAIVFRDVAEGTDVVQLARRDEVEELRLLHAKGAPLITRYHVTLGEGVASARVREGRFELVDATGYVRLATAPMFAVDAAGVHRALSLRLESSSEGASGKVLVATLDDAGLAYPIAIDPLWTTKASMSIARTGHCAVTLASGQVLVAGGSSTVSGSAVNSAETYDPATNVWSATSGNMLASRTPCQMVLLPAGSARAGQVLVVGGGSSDIYNPATRTFSATGNAPTQGGAVVIGLTGGKVVMGGTTFGATPYPGTVYDPTANTWTNTGDMGIQGSSFKGGPLATDGIVAGGSTIGLSRKYSIRYSPSANTWTATATTLTVEREDFAIAPIAGGRLFAAGGYSRTAYMGSAPTLASAEIFNPTTNSWAASTATMVGARRGHTMTTLSTGRVLVLGGTNGTTTTLLTTAELYDPAADSFATTAAMPVSRKAYAVVALPGGGALVTGGDDGTTAYSTVELYSQYATGAACSAVSGIECLSGFCVESTCCSTSSCAAGYHCNAPSKPGVCTKYKGSVCAADSECETGHCADGVCCDLACKGQCEACNLPTKGGTCSPVTGAPATGHTACTAGTDTCSNQVCNGTDRVACHYPTSATPCGTKGCTSGIETHVSTCDAAGKCSDKPVACGSYVCDATTSTCFTTCTSSAACAAGFYCDGTSHCVPLLGLGTKCSSASPCGSGLTCVDGVCCGTASCPVGSTCAAPGSEGTCIKSNGTSCTTDPECASKHCADGVCCDTACNGQCEACDVDTSGTCTPVTGKPHAGRPACASDPSNVCAATSCDGAERTTCAAKTGSSVVCRTASCKDGVATSPANCVGDGSCPAPVTSSCNGYVCLDATSCRTSCTVDGDCTSGYTCQRGKCAKAAATCSADGTSLETPDGKSTPCAPYLCKDSACGTTCAATDECAAGNVCNTATGTCDPAEAPGTPGGGDTGSSGGCSTSGTSTGSAWSSASLPLLAMAALLLGRRRRDRRVSRAVRGGR